MARLLSRHSAGRRERGLSSSSAVAKFAAGGLVALAAVALGSFFLMRHIGTTEATDNAKEVTRILGREIVRPAVTDGVLRERPKSLARLDHVVKQRVLHEPIVRVKIWTSGGRIVYSDEPRLIGSRYRLDSDELRALHSHGVEADVSDLSAPENRFERSQGQLVEVYLGLRAPNGRPLLFESYQRFSSIAASGSSLWRAFAPALIGALVLLALIQVPLASSMARRLRRGHAEREALLQRAVEASDRERRRIASDLHDGVVQRLAGASFSLAAAAERADGHGDAREALAQGAAQARQGVRELRSLLVEIYPPSLERSGLGPALHDLLAAVEGQGISTDLHVDPGLRLDVSSQEVMYRVAQEAVRNAARHADPSRISVSVTADAPNGTLVVEDDGVGVGGASGEPVSPAGHLGLQLMHDLATDAGGVLDIGPRDDGGTRVRLEVPRE